MKRWLCVALCFTVCFLTACTNVASSTVTTPTTTTTVSTAEATSSVVTDSVTTTDTTTASTTTTKRFTTTQSTTTTATTTTTFTRPSITEKSEMRGAWVSYIEINTLLSDCKTVAQAKTALNGMLNTCEEFGVNTIFFHVRANSDAYYRSSYFKPSVITQKLLNLGFDPLSYVVSEAHKRDMELHAWINPYRIGKDTAYRVDNVPTFKDGSDRYYYVPTSSASQALILNGVRELITNYAIDGIQYDDYFYPRDVLSAAASTFEKADYAAYTASGGTLSVENWRRAAVDSLISATHALTKSHSVVFGVSPASDADDTYSKLYGNPKKWISVSGYVDYVCPQIYTGFEHSTAAFDEVTDKWLSYPRHASVKLYVGLAVYKAGLKNDAWAGAGKAEWTKHDDILKRSVTYLRSKNVSGFSFYSYSYLKPDSVVGLSSTNDLSVAKKEVQQLLTVL